MLKISVWGMRPCISVTVTAADRRRLEAIAGDRNSPQKHVWWAEIVLLSGDGLGTVEIMRRAGKSNRLRCPDQPHPQTPRGAHSA
jgi:hypothetical protein